VKQILQHLDISDFKILCQKFLYGDSLPFVDRIMLAEALSVTH